jgi:hypothetical protein
MTPEKRAELTKHLAGHGMSVLMTKDFDSILMQLARLAQFERLMETKSESDKRLSETIKMVRLIQGPVSPLPADQPRLLEILDIPTILTDVHKALHRELDHTARIDHNSINAATAAFIGILFRR